VLLATLLIVVVVVFIVVCVVAAVATVVIVENLYQVLRRIFFASSVNSGTIYTLVLRGCRPSLRTCVCD
jgi:hypothetical protein